MALSTTGSNATAIKKRTDICTLDSKLTCNVAFCPTLKRAVLCVESLGYTWKLRFITR